MTPLSVAATLVVLPQPMAFAFAVKTSVPMRRPGLYFLICTMLSMGLYLSIQLLPPPLRYEANFLHMAALLALPLPFVGRGDRGKALLCAGVYMSAMTLAEVVIAICWAGLTDLPYTVLEQDRELLVILRLVYLFLMGVLLVSAYWVLGKMDQRVPLPKKGFPLLLLLLNQGIVLDILLYVTQSGPRQTWKWLLLGVSIACTVIVDIVFLITWRNMRQAQSLEAQLTLMEQQMGSQLLYYNRLKENMDRINRIRHDLNNQLQTAYTLLESGEREAARQQLDMLGRESRNKVGPAYCTNLVADAVFTEKAMLCEQRDIRLEIRARLPAELPIAGVHLCSALSNILDNAIAGCQGCAPRWIELTAELRAGCLTLRCQNPTRGQAKKNAARTVLFPEHGLGLDILRHIAKLYGGEVQTWQEEGVFTTVLLLPLPAEEAAGQ